MKLTALQYGTTRITENMAFPGGDRVKALPISLLFFLIETENRRILVDTGCDTMAGFPLYTHERPVQTLARLGLSPADITDVILTHSHGDHASGAHYYPGACFWLHADALEAARKYLPENAQLRLFRDSAEPVPGVKVLYVGGHAEGSCIVSLGSTILCSDECYTRRNLTDGTPTGSSHCPEKSAAFLTEYTASHYRTILFHDPDLIGHIGTKTL